MYELEPLPGSEARLLGEGVSPLLRQYADVAELLHVVEAREASHHLLGAEPLQGLKVKVPKALVPLPRLVVPASCKTKRLGHLKASRPLIRVLVINDNGLWINDFI